MGKVKYEDVKSKSSELLALASVSIDELKTLVPHLEKAYREHLSKWCINGQLRKKRSYTTYKSCPLATTEDRLLFVMS